MNRKNPFATRHPLVFSFIVTLTFILMVLITSIIVSARWLPDTPGWYISSAVGRVLSISIFLLVLGRLGWLRSAGFTRPGSWHAWVVGLLSLAYAIGVSAYAMTGNLDFRPPDLNLTVAAILFIMAAASFEEVAFRGLVLHALVRDWGGTRSGLNKSVIASALFFGGMHLVNALGGQPLPEVLLQCVVAVFLGIFLGAFVIHSGSVYPAILFHGMLNTAGYLNLTSNDVEGIASGWLLLSGLMLPLALFGLYQLRGVSAVPVLLDPAGD